MHKQIYLVFIYLPTPLLITQGFITDSSSFIYLFLTFVTYYSFIHLSPFRFVSFRFVAFHYVFRGKERKGKGKREGVGLDRGGERRGEERREGYL